MTLPIPPAPARPVGAETGADEEAGDLGLAEAELVVGGEGLGAVDQLGGGDLAHRRDAPLVAAHNQPVAVLAVIDEQVGVAQGGQVPATAPFICVAIRFK